MVNFNKDVVNNTGSIVNGDITEDNDVNIASGKGATILGEDSFGVVASGTGSTAAFGDVTQAGPGSAVIQDSDVGAFNNNSDGAVAANGDVQGVNTGVVNDSVFAGDDVSDTVNGDGNLQFNPDGGSFDGSALSFGSGDATAVGTAFNSQFAGDNSSNQQIQGNELGEGAAIGGRDAQAVSDDDVNLRFEENNLSNIENSVNANSAQDDSTADADQDFEPVRVDVQDSFKSFEDNSEDNDVVESFNLDD